MEEVRESNEMGDKKSNAKGVSPKLIDHMTTSEKDEKSLRNCLMRSQFSTSEALEEIRKRG